MSVSGQPVRPKPRDGVMNIPLYVPGKSKSYSTGPVYKLSSNETPLGASSKAIDAYRQVAGQLELYPDGGCSELREAIGEVHGIHPERILCGAGSDEVLSLLAYTFLEKGDEAIYCEHGFLVYPIAIQAAGATPVVVKEQNCVADVDAILAAVTDKTKMVFLANPNNPTGTYLPFSEIRRLHAGLPGDVVLVLDAAYAEYVSKNDYESGIELAGSSENVVMSRTFSKIYGLASLRLGWCFAPEAIINAMHRIRGPFNVSGAAQSAGISAIRDQDFVRRAVAHNDEWLPKLTKGLESLGLEVTPSVGNFVLMHFPDVPGKGAVEADAYLLKHGCVLRLVGNYGFPNGLRMTVGSADACEAVLTHLEDFLKGA
ncbi:histidinol-phosphate transaminase [Cohaesibacter celericrescens]|uniref:Histidinol-phosphate aminotransferase n=1 Tax=Cohaesibacter celericrescens TaxID=2067669 RepID=A0A2N5XUF5_9HYPH|nr:histidinol-phosphate transaminase [Cohaesibacter celericrescens]PLW78048.1 histidinol-phosphate transaminase [Cohaesibacter celericrescens]